MPREPRGATRGATAVSWRAGVLVTLVLLSLTVTVLALAPPPWTLTGPDEPDAAMEIGASSDDFSVWTRNDDGTPVRWDPCSGVDVLLRDEEAPRSAEADLVEALHRLEQATGIELRLVGRTGERPAAARLPYQPERHGERWAPVLVAWAAPAETDVGLRSTDRGIALPVAVGPEGDRTYVSGQVVLNAERTDLQGGFEQRERSWGATLLHELAHVLGLGHAEGEDQLMQPHPGSGPVELGEGDLAGLRAVGADGGCRTVPRPRPVTVELPAGIGH